MDVVIFGVNGRCCARRDSASLVAMVGQMDNAFAWEEVKDQATAKGLEQ
jgi:hypothetical protein